MNFLFQLFFHSALIDCLTKESVRCSRFVAHAGKLLKYVRDLGSALDTTGDIFVSAEIIDKEDVSAPV